MVDGLNFYKKILQINAIINLLKINVVLQIKECNFAPHRGMEQLVARRAHNPKVIGSSPVPATKIKRFSS
jgi:hypothetical protein